MPAPCGLADPSRAPARDPAAAGALPILARVETHTRRRRLAWSTAVFSLATGLSRILGLLREVVARSYFGVNGAINAFDVAFLIPNTIRALVADAALSGAFVPVFSDLLDRGERARAWRVASSLLLLVMLFLAGITAFFIVIAPLVMHAFGYGAFATTLARLLFPIVVLLGVFGILVGILNSYDEFAIPALAPVVWNVAIIIGLVFGVPRAHGIDDKLYVYAVSILVATVIQTLLPLPWLRGRDGHLHMVFVWRDPGVRRIFVLMLPISIGLGLININAVIDTFFASRFIDRYQAPSAINAAFRLYMLPQGMFSVAVATVLFPTLTRLASRNDIPAFRNTVNAGLRQIAFLLVPASIFTAVLAEPIVRLVYERGKFTSGQSHVVAGALAAFALGLTFNGFMLMLNRGFFSLQIPWLPTWVALGNLGLNAVLDAAFFSLGVWGLPLATAVVNIAGTIALLILLRRQLGGLELRASASACLRIVIASIPVAIVSFGVWWALDDLLGHDRFITQLLSVTAAIVSGAVVYLAACHALRVQELRALLSLRGRFRSA